MIDHVQLEARHVDLDIARQIASGRACRARCSGGPARSRAPPARSGPPAFVRRRHRPRSGRAAPGTGARPAASSASISGRPSWLAGRSADCTSRCRSETGSGRVLRGAAGAGPRRPRGWPAPRVARSAAARAGCRPAASHPGPGRFRAGAAPAPAGSPAAAGRSTASPRAPPMPGSCRCRCGARDRRSRLGWRRSRRGYRRTGASRRPRARRPLPWLGRRRSPRAGVPAASRGACRRRCCRSTAARSRARRRPRSRPGRRRGRPRRPARSRLVRWSRRRCPRRAEGQLGRGLIGACSTQSQVRTSGHVAAQL